MSYLKSWFIIDIFAIIPFDLIIMSTASINYQGMIRMFRIGRMYKLVRLTKLIRILKVVRKRSKIATAVKEVLAISAELERLIFGMIMFLIVLHIVSCLWIFFGYYDFIEWLFFMLKTNMSWL